MQITRRQQEILDLLQEECGEVIQQVSKIRRFGPDFDCRNKGETCLSLFQTEVFDALFFIDLLAEEGLIKLQDYDIHAKAKRERLEQWSDLYVNNSHRWKDTTC